MSTEQLAILVREVGHFLEEEQLRLKRTAELGKPTRPAEPTEAEWLHLNGEVAIAGSDDVRIRLNRVPRRVKEVRRTGHVVRARTQEARNRWKGRAGDGEVWAQRELTEVMSLMRHELGEL